MPPPNQSHFLFAKRIFALSIGLLLLAYMIQRSFYRTQVSPVNSMADVPAPLPQNDDQVSVNHNTVPYGPLTLLALVNRTLTIHPSWLGTLESEECGKFTAVVESMLELDASREDLVLTVNRGLSFVCSPLSILMEMEGGGSYNAKERVIYITPQQFYPDLFTHETRHHLRLLHHSTPSCNMTYKWASFPIYLEIDSNNQFSENSKKALSDFNKALDEGDSIIRNFRRLWILTKGGRELKRLQIEERKVFQKYLEAAATCLKESQLYITRSEVEISQEIYNDYLAKGWSKDNLLLIPAGSELDYISWQITAMNFRNNKIYASFWIPNSVVWLIRLADSIKQQMETSYSKLSALAKIRERTELTFQALSKEGMEVFYPGVAAMIAKDRQHCPLPPSTPYLSATLH